MISEQSDCTIYRCLNGYYAHTWSLLDGTFIKPVNTQISTWHYLRLTLIRLGLVQVAVVANGRSSASELNCCSVVIDADAIIDEVENATLCVVCNLESSLDELFVGMTIGGHYSQCVDSRAQRSEGNMATRACSIIHTWYVYTQKTLVISRL